MKCSVCGSESGKYSLCRSCNAKRENGEIIKCNICGKWHYSSETCSSNDSVKSSDKFLYDTKKVLISKSEQGFYDAIKVSVPEGFCVFPQINLASIINKTDGSRFHNELFRNVDFLVTDAEYSPKLIIEINDSTHLNSDRKERDEKVRKICEEAGLPIVKLWTSYGINQDYIRNRISETIKSLPMNRIHHFSEPEKTQEVVEQLPESVKELGDLASLYRETSNSKSGKKKGCYIATCVYGNYDCSSVWILRRYRDKVMSKSFLGRAFISLYYAFSPKLVKVFGNKIWFKKLFKKYLDEIVKRLRNKGFEDTPYFDL